ENLLAPHASLSRHPGQDGGRIEVALTVRDRSTGEGRGAVGNRVVDELGNLTALTGVDDRTELDALVQAIADLHCAHAFGQTARKLIGNRLVDNEAVRGSA